MKDELYAFSPYAYNVSMTGTDAKGIYPTLASARGFPFSKVYAHNKRPKITMPDLKPHKYAR